MIEGEGQSRNSFCELSVIFAKEFDNFHRLISSLSNSFWLHGMKFAGLSGQAKMKRLFQSLSRTNDGAFIIDGRHRIIFWNQGAEQVLGFTAEEVLGRQCFEILGGRDDQGRTLCQRFCLVLNHVERGDVVPNMDVRVRTLGNGDRWLNVTTFVYPVADKQIGGVIVHLFRDVTEKKDYQDFVDQLLSLSGKFQKDGKQPIYQASPTNNHNGKLTSRAARCRYWILWPEDWVRASWPKHWLSVDPQCAITSRIFWASWRYIAAWRLLPTPTKMA